MADPLPDPEAALDRYRRTGDPKAFGALFDATAGELHRAALSMLSDAVAADDAVQQTYVSALRLLDRFESGRRVMPWLVGLLEGHVMHARRSVARRRVVAAVPPDAPAPLAEDALPDADAERTRAAIEMLEEPYRSTALLRWRYGLEPAEIAHVRGEPPGTTRSILSRAVAQLRRALGVVPAFLAALSASSLDGIAGIRVRVMTEAARTGASIAGAGAAAASIGGVLVGKKAILVGVAVLATIGAAAWVWRGRDDTPSDVKPVEGPAELATAAGRLESAKPRDPSARAAARPETADPSRYHGRVVDTDGKPVAGARVLAFPADVTIAFAGESAAETVPGAMEVAVGDDGRFVGPPLRRAGGLSFLATAPGFAPALRPLARAEVGDLVLRRMLRLFGHVLDTDGKPVVGARIRRVSYLDAARDEATAMSAEGGAYAIALAPAAADVVATQQIEVTAPAFARLNWSPPSGDGTRAVEQDLVLTRGAIVRGRVFDADTKRGLAGVAVRLASIGGVDEAPRRADRSRIRVDPASRILGETTSGPDGAFRFDGVPCAGLQTPYTAGTERGQVLGFVGAWVDGYAPAGDGIPVVAEGESVEVEIPLWPAATVVGRIVDSAGNPVANVTVWPRVDGRVGYSGSAGALPPGAPVEWLRTGLDGRFESRAVRASAGEATAASLVIYRALQGRGARLRDSRARDEGIHPARAGERVDVGDIALPSSNAPRVDVSVVADDGHPVAGALVRLSANPQAGDATTGDDGRCTLYWPTWNDKTLPETNGVVVTAAGFARASMAVEPKPPGAVAVPAVTFRLVPERVLRGRLAWRDGSPASGVRVLVGNAALPLDDVFPESGDIDFGVYVQNVVSERGQRFLGEGTTDADGRFRVDALPGAGLHVFAAAGSARVRVTLLDVAAEQALTLSAPPPAPAAPPLDVLVTDAATGRPITLPWAALVASPACGLSADRPTVGRLRFASVPAGTYRLTVSATGYVSETRDGLVVPVGDRPVVAVALRRGLEVEFLVRSPPEVSMRDRSVGLWTAPFGDAVGGRIDPDGRARLRGLRAGRYLLAIYPPQVPSKATPILVPAAGDGWVAVDATTASLTVEVVAGGLVHVHVTDERLPETAPAAATSGDAKPDQPDASPSGGPSLTIVDADSQTIANVPVVARGFQQAISRAYRPGRYRLTYRGPDGRSSERDVVVEAGGYTEPRFSR